MNQFIHPCHAETAEILTNAEHAYQDGEITREQRNDAVMMCIAAETEDEMLREYQEAQ